MKITLPDGSTKEFAPPVTAADVAASIGEGLAKAAIGAKVNGELYDLHRPLPGDCELAIITRPRTDKKGKSKWPDGRPDPDALYLLRHSCAHVMAEAICRLWPDTQLAYGPPLDNGFYYDIKLDTPISSDDFPKIEAEMKKIIEEDRPFVRYELDADTGFPKLDAEGNKYKVDNAKRACAAGARTLSWYVTGPAEGFEPWSLITTQAPEPRHFEDLCMGPHIPSTGVIGAFKVMSVASSHWHGDVNSDRFQRIYGTAFFTQADLDEYLENLEQARQRDHRVIGPRLGLFTIDDKVGQGLILWKPNGAIVRQELQNFIAEHLNRQGYKQVFTPHIGKLGLYKTSGHYPYYQDSQYPPLVSREQVKALAEEGCSCAQLANMMEAGEIDGYLLKPMNCPHHIRIFASDKHSYRDLPIRLAEFGTVYRWEQSGELGGMTRVRGFTQDDAHLFCTEAQVAEELQGCLELVKIVFNTLGMTEYRVRVGLRDPDSDKYVGEPSQWDKAEAACIEAAKSLGVEFSSEAGEAAFYGPKIDFVVKDVIGREWQLGTVQVDYQLPIRFDLSYTGADNQPHRPVMIHRAPFGSMERFIGVLIEHFNGAFPLWLAPQQMRVLPISDKFLGYANKVADTLKAEGFRVAVDAGNERLNAKIKLAQEDKVPYMLVVGGKDQEAGTVSVRHRSKGDQGAVPLDSFIESARQECNSRSLGD
ncbi:MAG: threonine--tRNA ligase [Phycisphaeraceae bacterium]